MTDKPSCWRCSSTRAKLVKLSPRYHTTHSDWCDCRMTYWRCVNAEGCKQRRYRRMVSPSWRGIPRWADGIHYDSSEQ